MDRPGIDVENNKRCVQKRFSTKEDTSYITMSSMSALSRIIELLKYAGFRKRIIDELNGKNW